MPTRKITSETFKDLPAVYAATRKDWRRWLEKNHTGSPVWLIQYRKASSTPSVGYVDAVEEALCFGWIDSKQVKRDEESSYLYFAQRKPKGNWSQSNKERVARLTEQGLMTPAGQHFIDLARENGAWDALVAVENEIIPDDLQQLFDKNKKAFDHFKAFAPSSRRLILQWVLSAKRPETREKRIRETVALAAENKKAHHP